MPGTKESHGTHQLARRLVLRLSHMLLWTVLWSARTPSGSSALGLFIEDPDTARPGGGSFQDRISEWFFG
jgi:hypothetical protein